jgi:hypothetical protein
VTPIYHITHIRNLRSIIGSGGLHCDHAVAEQGFPCLGIAHTHLKQRRAVHAVPAGPGGVLADYVPFYFAPRSPMLFAIRQGNVEGYQAGQAPILHLVSRAETVASAGLRFAFTDGHAVMEFTAYFDTLKKLDKIDWKIMKERYWRDTPQDGDRSRRRQAEFLVHDFVPWSLVDTIGVIDRTMAAEVNEVLAGADHKPQISVQPTWYY